MLDIPIFWLHALFDFFFWVQLLYSTIPRFCSNSTYSRNRLFLCHGLLLLYLDDDVHVTFSPVKDCIKP